MAETTTYDPNNLLRQFGTVSRSHRSLVAECERQQSRLIQLLHWYDHQRHIRDLAISRQCEKVNTETRQQINMRSKMVMRERTRLQYFLDNNSNEIDRPGTFKSSTSSSSSSSSSNPHNPIDDRKRKIYGCLLPQFKAPLTRSSDNWSQLKSTLKCSQINYEKPRQFEQYPLKKYILSPIEQRKRMNTILYKCEQQFEQFDGHGYEHKFTSKN